MLRDPKKLIPIILGVILLIAIAGGAGYFFYQYQKTQKELETIKTDPSSLQRSAEEETRKLVEEVGKLIVLPQGEEPTVATITEIDKLKDQPFFANAKNGYKVLIYTNAKKAILYDPDSRKIVDVGPINVGSPAPSIAGAANPTSTTQPSPTASPLPVRVTLRNGTSISGLANQAENKIKVALPEARIVRKENAANNTYEQSSVVVISSSLRDSAQKIADSLGASIGSLPEGEAAASGTDVLVILGADQGN